MAKSPPPVRHQKYEDVRPREHLTPAEVERLIRSARKLGRYGHRDATMLLLAYRHGFRASELVRLRRAQCDLDGATLHVRRAKKGKPATHRLGGDEIRAIRKLVREHPGSAYVFVTERGGPMITDTFGKIVARAGEAAGFDFRVHPHMLRHSCGYKLANDGQDTRAIQDYLGHSNIRHTEHYTRLSATRFDDFFDD